MPFTLTKEVFIFDDSVYMNDRAKNLFNTLTSGRAFDSGNTPEPGPSQPPPQVLIPRAIAFFLDLCIIALIKISIHIAYGVFLNDFLPTVAKNSRQALNNGTPLLHILSFLMIYTTYFLYTNYILNGKTFGKIVMALTTVKEDFLLDHKAVQLDFSFRDSLNRAFGYLLCYASFGTFFIFNFASEDRRGISDYLSASRTVTNQWLEQTITRREHNKKKQEMEVINLDQKQAA